MKTEWFRKLGLTGQGLVEYALIILLVALAIVTTLGVFRGALSDLFSRISSALPGG